MIKVFVHNGSKETFLHRNGYGNAALLVGLFLALSSFIYSTAYSQTASFTAVSTTGNFCAPATIQFTPTSSVAPVGYYWKFGTNNEVSELPSPAFTYSAPGVYKVVLFVMFVNSVVEVEKNITIYGSPAIAISASKTSLCKPEDISFILQSNTGLSDITWDFGDSVTQTGDGNNRTAKHYFDRYQNYNLQVKATSLVGCVGTTSIGLSLQQPIAEISASEVDGCVPLEVTFGANASTSQGNIISSFSWDFDDGSPAVSGSTNSLAHTYTKVDSFNAKVSIITLDGCKNTFSFPLIKTGSIPAPAKISVDSSKICASEKVKFIELNAKGTNYSWEISNGTKSETAIPAFVYKFNSLGKFKVKVTPEINGCIGVPDSIETEIVGVLASFSYNNTCANKSLFSFRNTSKGKATQIRWDMGDGSAGKTTPLVDQQFSSRGEFPVKLFVSDDISGCSDSITTKMYTAVPVLIPSDTFFCKNSRVTLGVKETYINPKVSYNWLIAGRTLNNTSGISATIDATNNGLFTNRVIINNGTGYCRDTLTQSSLTRIGSPISLINSPSIVCFNDSFWVNDLSTPAFTSDTIKKWTWNLQNGEIVTGQGPWLIPYTAPGIVQVKLEIIDNKGCIDSTNKTTQIRYNPLLRITQGNQKVCEGKDFTLNALAFTPVNWSPASEVSCPTCTDVVVKPLKLTTYTVATVDSVGCKNEQSVTLDVSPFYTLPQNLLSDTVICPGVVVRLDLKVKDKIIQWSPVTGIDDPTGPLALARPMVTTVYTATISDSVKCFINTVSATILVNPQPAIDMGPDLVLPYEASFTLKPIYTGNIVSYTWQQASGLSCIACPFPSGKITRQSFYTVDVESDKGCISSGRIQVSVECDAKNIFMPNAFSPNGDGLNDTFYPITRGIKEIKKFIIYNRFGELVFQRDNFQPNDKSLGWNGMHKGQLQPMGHYVYFVEAICELGVAISKKGDFVIAK